MGRPFLEKFSSVVWEAHQAPGDTTQGGGHGEQDGELLQRWKEGKTGFPIVDAAMRCIKEMGWVHNRMRMIVAMFLVKDLMIDWRIGERVGPVPSLPYCVAKPSLFRSTLWKHSLTETLHRTMGVGSGVQALVWTHAHTLGYSTHIRKA